MASRSRVPSSGRLVVESEAMRAMRGAMAAAIEDRLPVLLEGEPGVGKEYVARVIHRQSGRRAPLQLLQPPAVPSDLVVEEMLQEQQQKLERASGGSILVKEIWRFPVEVQGRLVGALCERGWHTDTNGGDGSVWVMISSRVGRDESPLAWAPGTGPAEPPGPAKTLDDLWSGCEVRRIVIPPLRRRTDDIPVLADSLNREQAKQLRRDPIRFSTPVLDRLVGYPWPGNVSQLKAVIYRLLRSTSDPEVNEGHLHGLMPELQDEFPLSRYSLEDLVRAKLRVFLERVRGYQVDDLHSLVLGQVERPLLELVLEFTDGNQLRAAKILGLNRNTLRKKIRAHGIVVAPRRGR